MEQRRAARIAADAAAGKPDAPPAEGGRGATLLFHLRESAYMLAVCGWAALFCWLGFSTCMYFAERGSPDAEVSHYYKARPCASSRRAAATLLPHRMLLTTRSVLCPLDGADGTRRDVDHAAQLEW